MNSRDYAASTPIMGTSSTALASSTAACALQLPGLGLLGGDVDLLGLLLPRPSAAC